MTFPFKTFLTDNLKTYVWTYLFIIAHLNGTKHFHIISSKNLYGEFYARTAPGFWAPPILILSKMSLLIFQKMYWNFYNSFTTNVAPYSLKKIRLYTRDSSDDFRKSLIHEMYRCQCMILMGINVLASVVICSIVNSLFNISTLREKKQVLQCTNSKIHFVKRNFHLLKI